MNSLCFLAFLAPFLHLSFEGTDHYYTVRQNYTVQVTVLRYFFSACQQTGPDAHRGAISIRYNGEGLSLIQESKFVFCSVGNGCGGGACDFRIKNVLVEGCCGLN
jgi:hypothetical protein